MLCLGIATNNGKVPISQGIAPDSTKVTGISNKFEGLNMVADAGYKSSNLVFSADLGVHFGAGRATTTTSECNIDLYVICASCRRRRAASQFISTREQTRYDSFRWQLRWECRRTGDVHPGPTQVPPFWPLHCASRSQQYSKH